jgi:hypothetical protein
MTRSHALLDRRPLGHERRRIRRNAGTSKLAGTRSSEGLRTRQRTTSCALTPTLTTRGATSAACPAPRSGTAAGARADSALKHGYSIEDISHAIDMALTEYEIDPDTEPPKLLFIGPDHAGNLLEVIGGEVADNILLIWHADTCRPEYFRLLPRLGGDP